MNGSPVESLTVPARAGSLTPVTEFVCKGAQKANLSGDRTGQLELILEEILINLSLHAYEGGGEGDVVVTYSIPVPGKLCVEVSDRGREFDPLAAAAPNLTLDLAGRPVGGLGIFLIRSFADSLTYRREDGWNRLSFAVSEG